MPFSGFDSARNAALAGTFAFDATLPGLSATYPGPAGSHAAVLAFSGLLIGFGVPIAEDEPCRSAVTAALDMQRGFRALSEATWKRHQIRIGLGIGINYGPVIMGNVGSERFLAFTIIGDTVNVASRIQALAGPGAVMITQRVHELVPDLAAAHESRTDHVVLKGKTQDQALFCLAAS